jgi:hypothetical protein
MTATIHRVPAGTKRGGEFATHHRSEPAVDFGPDAAAEPSGPLTTAWRDYFNCPDEDLDRAVVALTAAQVRTVYPKAKTFSILVGDRRDTVLTGVYAEDGQSMVYLGGDETNHYPDPELSVTEPGGVVADLSWWSSTQWGAMADSSTDRGNPPFESAIEYVFGVDHCAQ